jgi:glycogen synthase
VDDDVAARAEAVGCMQLGGCLVIRIGERPLRCRAGVGSGDAEVRDEPEVSVKLVHVLRVGQVGCRVAAWAASWLEPAGGPGTYRVGHLVGRRVVAIGLHREVKPTCPHVSEKTGQRAGGCPLGDTEISREVDQLVDPGIHPRDNRRGLGPGDQRNADVGPGGAQRAQRGHGAQQITQPDAHPQQRHRVDVGVRQRPDALRVLRLCSVFEPLHHVLGLPGAARFDPIGGMQNSAAQLTRCLDAAGVRQVVVTSRLGGPRSRDREGNHAVVVRTGAPLRRLRQLWALAAVPTVARVAVNVVHAHQGEDLAVLPLALGAACRWRVPLVVTLHMSVRHGVVLAPRTALLKVLGSLIERAVLRRAAAVIALTPRAARLLVADGVPAGRIHVVPSGFAPVEFADSPDPLPEVPRPRVLFIGRLARQKRPLDLPAIAERLLARAQLVIVGDGPQRGALDARVSRSPARDRIHLVGFVPHRQIPAYLAHAEVFVLPTAYEELGTVLVEAMAAGLPVVATRVGGIPDLIQHGVTGLLAPVGDVTALAFAVTRLLDDRKLAAQLAAAGRRYAFAHHSWPALAQRVLQLYTDLTRT